MKVLVIAALLAPSAIHACLQVAGGDAQHVQNDWEMVPPLRHAMQADVSKHRAFDRFARSKTKEQIKQLEAIDLIYRGDYEKALALLHGIEAASPGRYDTAFNLGTAYELTRDNVNALKWISEGLKRNHRSLGGSEWLHVAILKAKIEAANRPGQLLTRKILELPDKLSGSSEIKVGGKSYFAASVTAALFDQLRERMEFVKPKDPCVADLLYSYALLEGNLDTEWNTMALENAMGLLQLAREYGFPDESLLAQHEREFWFMSMRDRLFYWVRLSPVILLVLLFPIWLIVKCRQEESWMYWAYRWYVDYRKRQPLSKLWDKKA